MNESGMTNLNTETMQQFLSIIARVSSELEEKCNEKKTRTQHDIEGAETVYYVPAQVITIAENIATLRDDIRKSEEKLNSGNFYPGEDQNSVMLDIENDKQRLEQNEQTLNTMGTPEEVQAANMFVQSLLEGRRGQVVLAPERRTEESRRKGDK